MRTDELIRALAADLKPVHRRRITHALTLAVVAGAIMAFGVMFMIVGLHPESLSRRYMHFELAKLLFTSSVVALVAVYLPRLARPGELGSTFVVVAFIPFVAIALIAVAAAASSHWATGILAGESWQTCLYLIPLLAVGPFATIGCALRTGAPTNLVAAGAAAGLVAGGLGALACSLPCVDVSYPSIAAWYGSMILGCAAVGAKFGPKLLRW